MNYSVHFILGLTTSFVCALVSCAMLILLLWQAPRRLENLWMALYLSSLLTWGFGSFFLRLDCLEGQNPAAPVFAVGWSFQLASFALFMVLCHHARLSHLRPTRVLFGLGALLLGVSGYLCMSGRAAQNVACSTMEPYTLEILPGGWIVVSAIVLFTCAAGWIGIRYRRTPAGQLNGGTLCFILAAASMPISILRTATIPILLASISAILFTRSILNIYLFRPMAEAKRKAEMQSAAKSIFLARMSHELRTPLHSILGYCELVLEDLADGQTQHARDDLHRVMIAGKQLLSLIGDVIDVAKIEEGKINLSPEDFELSTFIKDLAAFAAPLAEKNKNDFKLKKLFSNTPIRLYHDRRRLQQVLSNVLANAAKFTFEGQIELTVTDAKEEIAFRVSDTGIGMNAEQCARIFEETEEADEYLVKRRGSVGLGLPATRKLVRLMGGELSCTSRFGQGSTFEVRIPTRASLPRKQESA